MQFIEQLLSLRDLNTFRFASDQELVRLLQVMKQRTFAPSQLICEAGQIATVAYFIVSGAIEVSGFTSHEEVVGLESIVLDRPYRTTLRAGEDGVSALQLERTHLFTLISEVPSVLLASLGEEFGGRV